MVPDPVTRAELLHYSRVRVMVSGTLTRAQVRNNSRVRVMVPGRSDALQGITALQAQSGALRNPCNAPQAGNDRLSLLADVQPGARHL